MAEKVSTMVFAVDTGSSTEGWAVVHVGGEGGISGFGVPITVDLLDSCGSLLLAFGAVLIYRDRNSRACLEDLA